MAYWQGNEAVVSKFEKGKSYSMCFFKKGLIDIVLEGTTINSNGTIVVGTNVVNGG